MHVAEPVAWHLILLLLMCGTRGSKPIPKCCTLQSVPNGCWKSLRELSIPTTVDEGQWLSRAHSSEPPLQKGHSAHVGHKEHLFLWEFCCFP